MEIEEAFVAVAVPHERVERAQQGAGVDGAGQFGVAMEVRRLGPPLDRDWQQHALLDQLGDERLGRPRPPLAVVVGHVLKGRHAHAAGGDREQLLARLGLGRRRGVEGAGRQHPLGQVVQPGEVALAADDDDLAAVEEVLEHDFAVVPAPPTAQLVDALLEVCRRDGTAVTDPLPDRLDEPRVLVGPARDVRRRTTFRPS